MLNKIALAVNITEHLNRYCILAYLLYVEINIHCCCYLLPSNIGIAFHLCGLCYLLLLVLCLVTVLIVFPFQCYLSSGKN